ncbi:HNH endonuclease [Thiospirillum jenense]|uniref:HNH endonuclease n=2 Tax=Thiospirillum jenense TaxID=1653858 RepID=A0A839HCP1_9GAMM|nr:HNH endonuclease [Thiospirillum jenense]
MLTYHYTCLESFSLPFNFPLSDAIENIENDRRWGQNNFYEVERLALEKVIALAIKQGCIEKNNAVLQRILSLLSDDDIFNNEVETVLKNGEITEPEGNRQPSQIEVLVNRFKRDPKVAAYALREAEGVCHDCNKDAPFISKKTNMPFLEVHHIIPLKEGGEDTIDNVVALCPNCHRKRHYG